LFDPLAIDLGYVRVPDEAGFAGYGPADGGRPRIGFTQDGAVAAGTIRIAFGVPDRKRVDAAAETARRNGARNVEGPAFHAEYGDYYAVFFEDADGNRYEVVARSNAGEEIAR
jgi:catechol 2,3-dioxygenase-like lactoylglutathione lyase family enzyme